MHHLISLHHLLSHLSMRSWPTRCSEALTNGILSFGSCWMWVPMQAAADRASLHWVGVSSGRPQGQPSDSRGQASVLSISCTIFTSLFTAFSCSSWVGGLGMFFMYSSVILSTSEITAKTENSNHHQFSALPINKTFLIF